MAIAVYASGVGARFSSVFGVLVLVAIASWLAGGVLGFLFGVPRLRAQQSQSTISPSTNAFVPNTNLEQISDWLTKIIVGATLVQLGPLANNLTYLFATVGSQIHAPAATTAVGAAILLNFSGGFIWGYLWCSLRIFVEMCDLTNREEQVRQRESGDIP